MVKMCRWYMNRCICWKFITLSITDINKFQVNVPFLYCLETHRQEYNYSQTVCEKTHVQCLSAKLIWHQHSISMSPEKFRKHLVLWILLGYRIGTLAWNGLITDTHKKSYISYIKKKKLYYWQKIISTYGNFSKKLTFTPWYVRVHVRIRG